MKRTILITILIVGFTAGYGLADMRGGHMDRGQGRMESVQGHMDSGQGHMDSGQGHMEGMMPENVGGGLIHNMGQMSRLMQQMREMISNKPGAESVRKMSVLMQDMSEHFKKMSKIMKKGDASPKEMQELAQHNRMMQESYEMMRWK